ncbi:MAG: hypothetical protein JKX85_10670 [Phycisphaeraceae bacterium]|nr:hypothetical protein [Phycisphaeraceae bacterium]
MSQAEVNKDNLQKLRQALADEQLSSGEKISAMTRYGLLLFYSVNKLRMDVFESMWDCLEAGDLYHFDQAVKWLMGVTNVQRDVTIEKISEKLLH